MSNDSQPDEQALQAAPARTVWIHASGRTHLPPEVTGRLVPGLSPRRATSMELVPGLFPGLVDVPGLFPVPGLAKPVNGLPLPVTGRTAWLEPCRKCMRVCGGCPYTGGALIS